MRQNIAERNIETGGLSQSSAFRVEMNSMLFDSIINGIYADKIRSPFRELCTNARDGHQANGNVDEPFDVYLPSMINPTFKVRDYGVGLSHDEVMGIYSTMFASSKRDSNDAVGMIGLGSKSPFAYTSAFTVTSYYGGMMRVYSAYIGGEGVPQMALMHEKQSNARTGVEISFAVKAEDIRKFRDVAPDVLFGFSPFPNILNETFSRQKPEVTYSGTGWVMYNGNTIPPVYRTLTARQGCVIYPISAAAMGSNEKIYKWPVVIDFPIGELSVTTSREALGYDAKTKANIARRVKETLEQMTVIVDKDIKQSKTYLEACTILEKGLDNWGPERDFFEALKHSLKWKDRPLKTRFTTGYQSTGVKINTVSPNTTLMGVKKKSLSFNDKRTGDFAITPSNLLERKIYVEFDGLDFGPSRMRTVIADTNDELIWIRAKDKDSLAVVLDQLGGPEWIDLSTIERLKIDRDKVDYGKARIRYLTPSSNYTLAYGGTWDTIEPTSSMMFIYQKEKQFSFDNNKWMSYDQILEAIRLASNAKLIPTDQKIYCLIQRMVAWLDEIPMKPFIEKVLEGLKSEDLDKLALELNAPERNSRIVYAKRILDRVKVCTTKVPADLRDYATKMGTTPVTKTNPNVSPLERAVRFFMPAELNAAIDKVDKSVGDMQHLRDKYPLLDYVVSHSQINFDHYMELASK